MLYALNLFNLDDVEMYRRYLRVAGPVVKELGGDLIVMGRLLDEHPMIMPGSTLGGAQRWCIIATYKTPEHIIKFWEHPNNREFKHLRDDSTSDFVWALYEAADIMEVS